MTLQWVKVFGTMPRHHKTLHLKTIIGPRAFDFTVRALLWLSEFRPTGSLVGLRVEAIERGVEWDGEPGALVAAWKEVGFIRPDLTWHDWDEVQGAHKMRAEWKEAQKQKRAREDDATESAAASSNVIMTSADVIMTEGDVIMTSPLFSSSDRIPDPDQEIARTEPDEEMTKIVPGIGQPFPHEVKINRGRMNPDAPPVLPGAIVRPRLGWAGVGFMENPSDEPREVEAFIAKHAKHLQSCTPALDGKNNRPTIETGIRAGFRWYLICRDKPGGGHVNAMAQLKIELAKFAKDHVFSWKRDGGQDESAFRGKPRQGAS